LPQRLGGSILESQVQASLWNNDVLENTEAVQGSIIEALKDGGPPALPTIGRTAE
jgi:hypothetical protein